MAIDTNIILIVLGAVLAIALAFLVRIEMRLNKILRGKRAETLEDSIALIENDIKTLKNFKQEMSEYLAGVEKRVGKSIQGVGTVRFNAFKGEGTGGNQSFATGLLSEKGDGVVLSSLYSRDHVSIFAKPIKNGKSEYEMTEEEREALEKAKQMLKT